MTQAGSQRPLLRSAFKGDQEGQRCIVDNVNAARYAENLEFQYKKKILGCQQQS